MIQALKSAATLGTLLQGGFKLAEIILTQKAEAAKAGPQAPPLKDGEFASLSRLRAAGWRISAHNDYNLKGEFHTFYEFTHPLGLSAKGEGKSDGEALQLAERKANEVLEAALVEKTRAKVMNLALADIASKHAGTPAGDLAEQALKAIGAAAKASDQA